MSELIQKTPTNPVTRWKLLTGVSALALTASMTAFGVASAQDSDRPQVWIELGGDWSRLQNSQEVFAPPLMDVRPSIFDPSQLFEGPSRSSIDEEGRISLQPKDSDWVFSASVRYGRSRNHKHVTQQTDNPSPFYKYPGGIPTYPYHYAGQFAETNSDDTEQHTIVDFQVGRDIGLGIFGTNSSSNISVGVRFAQFRKTTNITLRSDPDWHIGTKYITSFKLPTQSYHSNAASLTAFRDFRGIGPSLSWNSSSPILGSERAGEVTLDWGVNAAVLFGRQRAHTHHQTTGRYHFYYPFSAHSRPITYQGPHTPDHTRSRSVTVPNLGGFAGLSLRYPNAKVSFGYKADFFFGAMDGGIDVRRTENVGFYGPFATISIGLGG